MLADTTGVTGYRKLQSKGCPGNLIAHYFGITVHRCAFICNNVPYCVGFEYNSAVDGCYLKKYCNTNNLVPKTRDEAAYIKQGNYD